MGGSVGQSKKRSLGSINAKPSTCNRSLDQAYADCVTTICLVTRIFVRKRSSVAKSGAQLLFWHKRYDLMPGPALSLLRGHKNCLDIETVLGGKVLADAPDFIDYGVPRHELFSHEFFRCADDRAFTRI